MSRITLAVTLGSFGLLVSATTLEAGSCWHRACCSPQPTCCAPVGTCCVPAPAAAAPVNEYAPPVPEPAAAPATSPSAAANSTYRSFSYDAAPSSSASNVIYYANPQPRIRGPIPDSLKFRADRKLLRNY
ncbi:MAG: hypothetical protein JSS02_30520 [Planctomycetes bacterium]|nr:hypothetical protein [Planctomycetota bacterium]